MEEAPDLVSLVQMSLNRNQYRSMELVRLDPSVGHPHGAKLI